MDDGYFEDGGLLLDVKFGLGSACLGSVFRRQGCLLARFGGLPSRVFKGSGIGVGFHDSNPTGYRAPYQDPV